MPVAVCEFKSHPAYIHKLYDFLQGCLKSRILLTTRFTMDFLKGTKL